MKSLEQQKGTTSLENFLFFIFNGTVQLLQGLIPTAI